MDNHDRQARAQKESYLNDVVCNMTARENEPNKPSKESRVNESVCFMISNQKGQDHGKQGNI